MNWLALCILVGGVTLVYAASSMAYGNGEALMPLDDVYIHFQYARQIAEGQPYVYNPGTDASSGATSLLYPYLLAGGYLLGFQGLSLGLWAMLIGAAAMLTAAWAIVLIARHFGASLWLATAGAGLFVVNGAFGWHFMSGMETGVITALTVLTLYAFITGRLYTFVVSGSLLAITRPEGSIMAGIAAVAYPLQHGLLRQGRRHHMLWLLLPLLAITVQPLVNLLVTGSATAAGTKAKSILYTVPFDLEHVVGRIWNNVTRAWKELATGTDGSMSPVVIAPLAAVGWGLLALRRKWWPLALTLLGWFILVTAAIATLDTAFWHFKRYHVPLIALTYPLALIGIWLLWRRFVAERISYALIPRYLGVVLAAAVIVPSVGISTEYLRLYHVNLGNILAQPLPMARWLAANTPQDARVAVHDVGMMRYVGQRHTIDMVGLTTPGAVDAWRNGPGAVAEFLMKDAQPDYVAAYTTARGLNYLADTAIYGAKLAGFHADYNPADNVALGANFQGIYVYQGGQPPPSTEMGPHVADMLPAGVSIDELEMQDSVNVAHVIDEAKHAYDWHSMDNTGFTTEVYQQPYINCTEASCVRIDGGRRIDDSETFRMTTTPEQDALLITRVHPAARGTFDVSVDGQHVATRWLPEAPGQWLDIPTLIPGRLINDTMITVEITPSTPGGYYMPYHHWLLQGTFQPMSIDDLLPEPQIKYQSGALRMSESYSLQDGLLHLNLDYANEGTTGDYRLFVHIYDEADRPPIAQADGYLLAKGQPLGNLLPGVNSADIMVDLREIPAGTYQIGLGLYDITTGERLMPRSDKGDITIDTPGRRVFVGEIEVSEP